MAQTEQEGCGVVTRAQARRVIYKSLSRVTSLDELLNTADIGATQSSDPSV